MHSYLDHGFLEARTLLCFIFMALQLRAQHLAQTGAPARIIELNAIVGIKILGLRTSLVVQWLRQYFHCGDTGSILSRGTKIPHAAQRGQVK